MDFPQYRKLSNDKAYYEILNDREFNEIQVIGKRAFMYNHKAEKYPEILRVKEMLDGSLEEIVSSSMQEFSDLKLNYSL